MKTIEIPVRELHARTGHYVRKAKGNTRVVVTDRGKPVAQIQALGEDFEEDLARKWEKRILLPEYEAIMDKPVSGDSTGAVSEDRDRGSDW